MIDLSKITDLIDTILLISNLKLVDRVIFLLSEMKILSWCKVFGEPMLLIDWVEAQELMSSFLNMVLLYCQVIEELKM